MITVETILSDYEAGSLTRRERILALARFITPATVDEVFARTPPDVAQELLTWAKGVPQKANVMIGGELSPETSRRLAEQHRVAAQAIQSWEKRREIRVSNQAGQPPSTGDPGSLGRELALEVSTFLEYVKRLTGTPVGSLKDNERNALARALRDDSRKLSWTQLNELLLLVNKDRFLRPFFDYFFPSDLIVARISEGIERFQKVAMLRFGSFVHAYRTLSAATSKEELEQILGRLCRSPEELEEAFQTRSPKILEIDPISREQTYLIGYLSARQITSEKLYGDLLYGAAEQVVKSEDNSWDNLDKTVRSGSKPSEQKQILSVVERYRKRFSNSTVQQFHKALTETYLPKLEDNLAELKKVQERATDNQDVYLTWDHMDIYFATSMRKRWEFEDLYDFVNKLMGDRKLAELNLRFFDPTQSYTQNRVNKGLVEALMLRRAKCTVYSVQDTDTLGKDSELAATLAQGKPVIAYVPSVEVEERTKELAKQMPMTIRERLSFLAHADSAFATSLSRDDVDFLRGFSGLEEFAPVWYSIQDHEQVEAFQKEYANNLHRLCRILALSEQRLYDSRAATLKDYHPLGLQVHLETGVAHGVLVVRTVADCADVLFRVLTNRLDLSLDHDPTDKIWYLREKISQSAYRVVTEDSKLTNCFWNFYQDQ